MSTLELPFGHTFDGDTIVPELDNPRLSRQLAAVWSVVRDGRWRTLTELAEATGAPEASVSARLRDLRKPRFGSLTVERRRNDSGRHEYRVVR